MSVTCVRSKLKSKHFKVNIKLYCQNPHSTIMPDCHLSKFSVSFLNLHRDKDSHYFSALVKTNYLSKSLAYEGGPLCLFGVNFFKNG